MCAVDEVCDLVSHNTYSTAAVAPVSGHQYHPTDTPERRQGSGRERGGAAPLRHTTGFVTVLLFLGSPKAPPLTPTVTLQRVYGIQPVNQPEPTGLPPVTL